MNHDHAVPQQILSILNPQFIVEESNGTVVLGRKVGNRTISVRGCQSGRMCALVVVQDGRDVRACCCTGRQRCAACTELQLFQG